MLNPDGVTIQQNDLKQIPDKHQKRLLEMNERFENFEGWKANGMGLDLNDNILLDGRV